MSNMVFCRGCGKEIHETATSCPFCGAKQIITTESSKSRTTAAILALFLGGLGVHWFYLGRTGLGFLYLLFCWTFIPSIAALVNFIVFLTMSDEKFAEKYS